MPEECLRLSGQRPAALASLILVAHVTREQLDRLLEQTLLSDDHGALARRLDELAQGYESGEVSRAYILALSAEEWRQAGHPDAALDRYQQAADGDGGDVNVDPRAGIADTLFELDRPDEARDVIEALRAAPCSPATVLNVAETLAAYGDLTGAHEWATEGVTACPPGNSLRESLLRTRYRIRIDLGLPEDDLDALAS